MEKYEKLNFKFDVMKHILCWSLELLFFYLSKKKNMKKLEVLSPNDK